MEGKAMAQANIPASTYDDLETWKNLTEARFELRKFSSKGDLMAEMIGSNKTFHISTRERHLNSEMAAVEDLDPFRNGSFSPVRLIDGTEDAEQIASNPNLMTETEMEELVKGNIKALKSRVDEVKNPIVLERMLQVASTVDATVGKVEAIKARLEVVSPSLYTEVGQ